jgi:hypothetical protein
MSQRPDEFVANRSDLVQRFTDGQSDPSMLGDYEYTETFVSFQFYGSLLSWTTREVTVPALNDSRYIGLSVYIVFICCTLGSLVTFIPSEQIQLSYFLTSFFILICTTSTVLLVFVPKVKSRQFERWHVCCSCTDRRSISRSVLA